MNPSKHLVAHHNHTVDRLYRSKPFTSDEERLEQFGAIVKAEKAQLDLRQKDAIPASEGELT